jgi:hypothetical protein
MDILNMQPEAIQGCKENWSLWKNKISIEIGLYDFWKVSLNRAKGIKLSTLF